MQHHGTLRSHAASDEADLEAQRATVLVVDDDADLRDLIADMLRDEGFPVRTARDGREAMDVIASLPRPAAMLLDLTMPLVGGRDVLRWLQSRPELADVAVCILSGEAAEGLSGASLAIRKPLLLNHWVRIVDWLRGCSGSS